MTRAILNRFAVTLLVVLSFTTPSRAEWISVEGILGCDEWIEARTTNRSVVIEHYFLGFLNGLALGHNVEFWRADGRKVSREAIYLWLDNYCRDHPLEMILKGIVALYKERSGWNPED